MIENVLENQKIHKIVFAGLDAVGKTSIYKSVIENVDTNALRDLQPTRGIERRYHKIAGEKLVFWDLGGQEYYRSRYFDDSRIFNDASLLLYVLDMQDYERFDESIEYLLQILVTLKNLDQIPRIVVLLHKYDPLEKELLQENLLEVSKTLQETSKFPSIAITKFTSSIYSDNLDTIVEDIIRKILPHYTNDILQPQGMVRKITYEDDKVISSTEFTAKSEDQEGDFQKNIAEHFRILNEMIDNMKDELE